MTVLPPSDFRTLKNVQAITKENNIVQAKVTESRHCSYCECSKCPPSAATQAFQSLWELWQLCLLVPEVCCPRSPAGLPSVWRSVSDGACDRPPTLPPDMVIQGVQSGEFGDHWSLAMKSGQLVWSQFSVARAVCAGAPSCWKMYPLGNQNSLTKN